MRIPPTAQVLHLTYTVREVSAEMLGGNCGQVDTTTGEIWILETMSAQFKFDTFVHELVHAHLMAMGHDDDESIVMAITSAILSFIRNNPHLENSNA